ncbi:MAG: sulfite exporter TauE/SafE family protein [Candidatus Acidiferrales bacterium]
MMKTALLITMGVVEAAFIIYWILSSRKARPNYSSSQHFSYWIRLLIGFVTNFLDTLGIGSFATTTSTFKFLRGVKDEAIPGTLNVGHAIPTVVEAFIYMVIVTVDLRTLIAMIVAAVLGAWLGAGIVARWPRRTVQIGMGFALICAAALFLMKQLNLFPPGGMSLGLGGTYLVMGAVGNFALGALMTLGIGLYAPCMILVSLLGMDPKAAFPIMMGSCAFLMPAGSVRFIRSGRYDWNAAIGLAIGGVPGVLVAAYFFTWLSVTSVRWLVIVVVLYTAAMMLRSAFKESRVAKQT